MNRLKIALLIGLCGLLSSCVETTYEVLAVDQVQVDPVTAPLLAGSSMQLNARLTSADGTALSGRTISWSSSATSVATVTNDGLLQAVGPGTATVTATAEGRSTTLGITVQSAVPVITALNPSSAARATAFQLTVTGSGFYAGSVVQLNGVARTTQFVSSTSLRVAVAATDFPNPGTVAVRVVNQAPGGGTSNTLNLTLVIPTMTIIIDNQLIRSINVSINGVVVGTANAASTAQFTGPQVPLTVSYTLNRQTTTDGTPVGETMSGVFPIRSNPGATETFTVDNVIGSDTYFAPIIDNRTAVSFLMGVNMGLAAENRCNCVVPAFTSNIGIGYYRLFSNSNVRAYNTGSNYTGSFVFWEGASLQPFVAAGSGRTPLFSTVTPMVITRAGEIGAADVVWGALRRFGHDDDVPFIDSAVPRVRVPDQGWRQTVLEPAGIVTERPRGQ